MRLPVPGMVPAVLYLMPFLAGLRGARADSFFYNFIRRKNCGSDPVHSERRKDDDHREDTDR